MNMLRFMVRRILSGLVVVWVVTTATFFLFFAAVPEQAVARNLAGKAASPQVLHEVARNLGLSQPILVQYWHFLGRLVHGNLGKSYYLQEPVTTVIKQDFPPTLSLVIGGVLLWLIVGLAVGIISATRARSLFDRISTAGVLAGVSAPTFVVGQLLLLVVFLPLSKTAFHWISQTPASIGNGFGKWSGYYFLGWVTLAIVQAAVYTRLSRGSLLDTLGEDYIRTARSKGLTERRVLYRHAVRSALTPVVSQLGVDLGALLGGVIVVEQVFGIQGLGFQTVQSIFRGDTPVVLGTVILATVFVVACNLVVDILYGVLDPRVRIA
jgi:peptide/nickel transport system permease protein